MTDRRCLNRHPVRRWKRWFGQLWLAVAIFCIGIGVHPVILAEAKSMDTVSMTTSVGFSGYFNKQNWVPVTVSLHHSGKAQMAYLVLQVHESLPANRLISGTLEWPVWLPANGTLSRQISVPGMVINGESQLICDIQGKSVARSTLNGNSVGNVSLVAVLSKHMENAAFLTGSSNGSSPVQPVAVNPSVFPDSSNLLNGVTAVAASPDALRSLSKAQKLALLTWTKLGGMVIVTGTQNVDGWWARYVPIQAGVSQQVSGVGLGIFANTPNPLNEKVAVESGPLSPQAILWASDGSIPLIAALPVGRGQIWQTSFLPSDPVLLGWSGNPALWSSVLQNGTSHTQSALVPLLQPDGVLSLAAASDALSPLRVPSLKTWAIVFLIYVVLIGPILFAILRRFQRAAWAWVILPLVSGLTTFGIYSFGLMVRPHGLLNEGVGVLELAGDGTAESYGIQAFTSPFKGGLKFQIGQPMLALPMATEEGILPVGQASVLNDRMTRVTFNNLARWSVHYVYAAGSLQNQGEIQSQLTASFGLLFGTVRNNTPYPLQKLALLWQGRMYQLGNIGPGQTMIVDQSTGASTASENWISLYGSYNHVLTHGSGRTLGNLAVTQHWSLDNHDANQVMFIATTSARPPSLPSVGTLQDVASANTTVLVRQYGTISAVAGGQLV